MAKAFEHLHDLLAKVMAAWQANDAKG